MAVSNVSATAVPLSDDGVIFTRVASLDLLTALMDAPESSRRATARTDAASQCARDVACGPACPFACPFDRCGDVERGCPGSLILICHGCFVENVSRTVFSVVALR